MMLTLILNWSDVDEVEEEASEPERIHHVESEVMYTYLLSLLCFPVLTGDVGFSTFIKKNK